MSMKHFCDIFTYLSSLAITACTSTSAIVQTSAFSIQKELFSGSTRAFGTTFARTTATAGWDFDLFRGVKVAEAGVTFRKITDTRGRGEDLVHLLRRCCCKK